VRSTVLSTDAFRETCRDNQRERNQVVHHIVTRAHDLQRILLYRLLHDRLAEGFEISSGFVPIAHEGPY
jgi:hypothetical protein